MPSVQKRHQAVPRVHHALLQTTFYGIDHPLSTPDAPIHQYLGIKYASVPARFRQSKLWKSYPPTVDASRHGPICPQPRTSKTVEEVLVGITDEAVPQQVLKQDEFECLNLNITCPAGLTSQSRLPVMLWVHGGGDRGSGSSWIYDGGPLVRKSILMGKPVILVTFNFRIGLFGFAAGPMIREDNIAAGEDGFGNYGLRDQRKVMEWLHHYIGDFGGDAGNITIFGESSGGADILCHLLSAENQTRPVFQRAIVQSALLEHNLPDVANAGWHLSRILSALHVTTVEQLRQIDADKLAALGSLVRAVDDGVFLRQGWKDYYVKNDAHSRHHHQLKDHIARARSRGRSGSSVRGMGSPSRTPALALPANLQPLIIGDCSADSSLWSLPASFWTPVAVVRRIKAVCQSLTKASNVMRAYDITAYTPDEEIVDRVLELVNDARVAWPTECVARSARRERGGRGVWRYVFDQEGPAKGAPHHGVDLIYLFDTVPLPASAQSSAQSSPEMFCDSFSDDDDNDGEPFGYGSVTDGGTDEEWPAAVVVDEWAYTRVRDAMQERWISFAHGEAPWREDKVFVFGPEGETGERSSFIFEGRRRKETWKEALEPLGMQLAQKVGLELSRGPPVHGF
ncbi:putative type-B carboxylesterase lipase family protein [Lyophyllum shimeji]|uniref:Carboxylic ester hydrolase n=1 Tax=Lyophyllum shimeji TaxID=47721 RepID=A0A9P3UN05_LYOSH|nr:putative type-B carboxylesterase lipase family protein [Lyophyllum shimeji]